MFKILAVTVFCALQIYSCHGYLDTKLAAKRMNQLISSWEIQGLKEKNALITYVYDYLEELRKAYSQVESVTYELDILLLSVMMDLDGFLDVVIDRRTTDLMDEEVVTTIMKAWDEMSKESDAITANAPTNCKFDIKLIARAYGRQFADEFATCALVSFDVADAISDDAQEFAETCVSDYMEVMKGYANCGGDEGCLKDMSNFMHERMLPSIETKVNDKVDKLVRAKDLIMARNRLQMCTQSVVKSFKSFMSKLSKLCEVNFN